MSIQNAVLGVEPTNMNLLPQPLDQALASYSYHFRLPRLNN